MAIIGGSMRQVSEAKRFSDGSSMTIQECLTHLWACLELAAGKMSESEFEARTKHVAHSVRFSGRELWNYHNKRYA